MAMEEPQLKRQRADDNQEQLTLYQQDDDGEPTDATNQDTIRTSSLNHPTMKLTGHKGSVYSLAFSPDGECLASGSFDMTCCLWSASGSCTNFNVLQGHKNAILDVKWTVDSEYVVTASADKTIGYYESYTGNRVKRLQGHEGIVNAVDTSRANSKIIASASDDKSVRLWDARLSSKNQQVGLLEHEYARTAVSFGLDGNMVYTAGIDNTITAWDIRASLTRKDNINGEEGKMLMKMKGHDDTITCLALNRKGTHLLSNSMDGTMKTWDIRPFVENNFKRHCKTFTGATHNAEKGLLNCSWSEDGSMVTGGSADKVVHIWDELTSEELYYLSGHLGCVNSVVFHPKENVIASGSSDKSIYIGELSRGS